MGMTKKKKDIKNNPKKRQEEPCTYCKGYGVWACGQPVPMGPMDASDGLPTKPCPVCGASANPMDEA